MDPSVDGKAPTHYHHYYYKYYIHVLYQGTRIVGCFFRWGSPRALPRIPHIHTLRYTRYIFHWLLIVDGEAPALLKVTHAHTHTQKTTTTTTICTYFKVYPLYVD